MANKTVVPNVISLLFIVLLGANYFLPFADLDFGWQIRTGEHIIETGDLCPVESFSYTIAGEPVPDFEWLYEVILYLVWQGFGFGGLKFLRVLLVAATFVLVGWRLHGDGIRWRGIVLSMLVAFVALSAAWNLRPLYITTIGLLLVSGWLHDHCTGKKRLTWWLPVVMLLWANLHPGVIVGQAVLFGAIAWEWINRWIRLNPPLETAALQRLTRVGGLGLLATLIGPNPIGRLLYPFKPELAHPIMRIFAEMQPLHQGFTTDPIRTGLVYLVGVMVAVTMVFYFRRYRLWEIVLLVGLATLGSLAFRSVQDCLLVMLALGVPHAAALLHEVARDQRRIVARLLLRGDRFMKRMFATPAFRFQAVWPLVFVGVLFLLSVIPPLSRAMPVQNAPDWPVAAVDHIEQNRLYGRYFGPPDYGSFLLWRLGGNVKTYTDTRGFYFPPTLLEDSHYIPQLLTHWRVRLDRVLDEYNTDYFLLETTGPRGEMWRRLRNHISDPLFKDNISVLLTAEQVRRAVKELDVQMTAGRAS